MCLENVQKGRTKTHACVFLFCLVMLNGIHGLCLFGFARQLDMFFVEGYTNLEEWVTPCCFIAVT